MFRSLRFQIAITIFLLEAVMMVVVLWQTTSSAHQSAKEQLEITEQVSMQTLSGFGRIALLTDEYNDLQPFLEEAVVDPHTLRALLVNEDNVIYASSDARDIGKLLELETAQENVYWRHQEIANATGTLGALWVLYSEDLLDDAYNSALGLGITIAFVGMFVISFVGVFFGALLTRRLEEVGRVAQQFARGNFDERFIPQSNNEIEQLGCVFNKMADEVGDTVDSLLMSENRFRSIFESCNDAILLIDPDKEEINDANPAACIMLGYAYDDLRGSPISEVHPDEMNQMRAFLNEVQREGTASTESLSCQTSDDKKIDAGISAASYNYEGRDLVLAQVRDITERKKIEKRLADSEQLFRTLIENSPVAVCRTDFEGRCQYVNDVWLEQTGQTMEQTLGYGWHDAIYPPDRERVTKLLKQNALKEEPWDIKYRFCRPDGSIVSLIGRVVTLRDEDNRVTGFLGVNVDMTAHDKIEQALRRSQKMDAIGQLSGGVAHDFNNILGIILGNINLLEHEQTHDDKTRNRLGAIKHSAQRAANLTRQLLGFSRNDSPQLVTTNLNKIILHMQDLIQHSLTPAVEISINLEEDLWPTEIEPSSLEDALLNLALNARDAMPDGGMLTIETRNSRLDENYCNTNPDIEPGDYIELIMSDTGVGIVEESMERIFDPFYTTKEQGKGTGLGLSMVFGFVQRSGGHIKAYSEPGVGTTMRVYLPREQKNKDIPIDDQSPLATVMPTGSEIILIVDDEISLLDMVDEALQQQGYTTFKASSGAEALEILASHAEIDMLFSDVVMPGGLNGYQLAEQACKQRPGLKVLLTSGFTEMAVAKNGQARFHADLLNKPYTLINLAQRIRKILDSDNVVVH